jgi:hypothetical protein
MHAGEAHDMECYVPCDMLPADLAALTDWHTIEVCLFVTGPTEKAHDALAIMHAGEAHDLE